MPIDDVARLAGVSKATVSRALNNAGNVSVATAERVRKAAAQLGYQADPAAVKLATGRTNAIAVLAPGINRWYFAALLRGVADEATALGMDVVLYDLADSGKGGTDAFEGFMRRRHVDGVLLCTFAPDPERVAQLSGLGIPAAAIGGPLPGIKTWCLDDVEVGRLATQHLLDLGHRDIQFIRATLPGDDDPSLGTVFDANRDRELGYVETMREAQLHARPSIAIAQTMEDARITALELLAGDQRPTAIFASTDEAAMGIMLAARELGIRIPEDLSIIGVDDHAFAGAFGLTTIRQRPGNQGAEAVRWLSARVQAPRQGVVAPSSAPDHTKLSPELVIRSSTAPLEPTA